MKRTIVFFLIVFSIVGKYASAADTLHLYNDGSKATFVISVKDYKYCFQNKLGRKAIPLLKKIDSLAADPDPYITIDKRFWMEFSFYEREDYLLIDNALMEAFQNRKMRIIKNGQSFSLDNTKIKTRKTRICNRKLSKVTGINWVIKASKGIRVAELRQSETKHAGRNITCF